MLDDAEGTVRVGGTRFRIIAADFCRTGHAKPDRKYYERSRISSCLRLRQGWTGVLFKLVVGYIFRVRGTAARSSRERTARVRTNEHRKGDGRQRDHPFGQKSSSRRHLEHRRARCTYLRAVELMGNAPAAPHQCARSPNEYVCLLEAQPRRLLKHLALIRPSFAPCCDGRFNVFFSKYIGRVFACGCGSRCLLNSRPEAEGSSRAGLAEILGERSFPRKWGNEIPSPIFFSKVFPFH